MTNPPEPPQSPTPDPNHVLKSGVAAARRHIFYTNERGTRFNLTALHRMNMHYMRKRILDEASEVFRTGDMHDGLSDSLAKLMRDYCSFFSFSLFFSSS